MGAYGRVERMPQIITDPKRIDLILDRGVITSILPDKAAFRELLLSGKRIRMYIGADPTSTALHLSHAKNYLLLEDFRQLGHEIIVLFGSFTARIGDPSGKDGARQPLSEMQVKENVTDWLRQIHPLMGFDDADNSPIVRYNDEWLAKLSFADVMELAHHFTVQQMLERDMFERRLSERKPIYLHEFFYPLMQGYDSVALDVDVEVGGSDQTFNMLAGRTLLRKLKNKEKHVVVVNLMENPKTGELMSKSRGSGVFLGTSPPEFFGSVMALPDEMIPLLLLNLTRITLEEIEETLSLPPRDAKMRAAFEITKLFHTETGAREAEDSFVRTFRGGGAPEEAEALAVPSGTALLNALSPRFGSKMELRRLVSAGAVAKVGGGKIEDPNYRLTEEAVLRIGKHRFVKILISPDA